VPQEAVVSALPQPLQVGDWRIEPELDRLSRGDSALKVEPRAMRVLLCLIERAPHVVTVQELLEAVWPDVIVGPASVYQAVALLRRTLGDDSHHPRYIAHVPRKGYRLIAPLGTSAPAPAPASAPAPLAARPDTATLAGPPGQRAAARAPSRHGRPLAAGIALLAVIGAAYLLVRPPGAPAPEPERVRATAREPTPGAGPSIAVLPFLDLSEKQDLGYFADGLSEELIDLLSRGSDLRVPARTSSFYFRGKPTVVRDIARALQVDNVLEGSVRRSGDRVRVTVQLIRAGNDYHLWSQSYERQFTEVFAVEDDIATAVTQALHATLSGGRAGFAELAGVAADSMSGEAHNLMLQCQYFIQRNTRSDADKAVLCYREVLRLAPQSAAVWSGYSDALWRQPALTDASDAAKRGTRLAAREAAEHAIALDPRLASPHATLAVYHRVVERDWAASQAELALALKLDPRDPPTLLAASVMAYVLGQFDRAIELLGQARARDPLNFLPYARLGRIYLYLGRLPEAEAAVRRRLDLSPEGLGGYMQLADVLLARGLPAAALEAVQHEPDGDNKALGLALAYHALGERAQADAALADFRHRAGGAGTELAEIYAFRGEYDQAFAALEAGLASADSELLNIKSDNYFIPMRADPRYRALLRKLKLPL
jgi:TolB-like protein/DNA-binding winged helix-turn-helix (wHTH) protein